MDVGLFVTCLTDTFYPRVGQAVVLVLERFGCRVHFPQAQTCCGQPMFNTGCHGDARALAMRLIEVFEDAEYVVTPSGSCCAMVRDYYPELFHGDAHWEPKARELVGKTFEFSEFLLKKLKVDLRTAGCRLKTLQEWEQEIERLDLVKDEAVRAGDYERAKAMLQQLRQLRSRKLPLKVTYHYSCHLRGLGMSDEAVRLLRQIEGIEYVPLEKTEQCCGFGGTFAVKYPEISRAMVRDKVECIGRSGADVLVCNDGGCTLNIAGMLHRDGVQILTKHIAEIIAQGLGLMPGEEELQLANSNL
jgi:L-lactate dehydrogenase complex protein LldE